MPGFDKTGPMGEGPMTGRKMGNCNPDNKDLEQNRSGRGGRGGGRGRGRGFGRGQGRDSGAGQGRGRNA